MRARLAAGYGQSQEACNIADFAPVHQFPHIVRGVHIAGAAVGAGLRLRGHRRVRGTSRTRHLACAILTRAMRALLALARREGVGLRQRIRVGAGGAGRARPGRRGCKAARRRCAAVAVLMARCCGRAVSGCSAPRIRLALVLLGAPARRRCVVASAAARRQLCCTRKRALGRALSLSSTTIAASCCCLARRNALCDGHAKRGHAVRKGRMRAAPGEVAVAGRARERHGPTKVTLPIAFPLTP